MIHLSFFLNEFVERLNFLGDINDLEIKRWISIASSLNEAERTHGAWSYVLDTLERCDAVIEPVVRGMIAYGESMCDDATKKTSAA